ncbi:Protein kinase domain-containing protein [Aphelenchoides besseyi]|nr:Protein kinase domain-containing protein [Aphelenchoides besseyi]
MEYLNKFRSTVSSAAAQVQSASRNYLPGNPIFREYEVQEQVASAGPGNCWKIFQGTKLSTKQTVSVWLFEKKQIEKWPRVEREAFPDIMKRGVHQLTRLRHPRLLIVEHALEESRDSFAFCTEEVYTSLANVMGSTENLDTRPKYLDNFKFTDIECSHGLFQLCEALCFLQNDVKLLHANICPTSVVVNSRGAWKLSGFEFCVSGLCDPGSSEVTYQITEFDKTIMPVMLPSAHYSAPELLNSSKCDTRADVFSLAMLVCTIFNNYKPVSRSGVYDKLNANATEIPSNWLTNVPSLFVPDLKRCLSQNPLNRLEANQLTRIAYFDDPRIKTLNYLESLIQMENSQKIQFFKGLPQILDRFPNRPLLQKVFPFLQFDNLELVPFLLPSVFYISEKVDNEDFAKVVFPRISPLFKVQQPYQIILMLLQKMTLLLEKSPKSEIRDHVLPMVFNAICNENPRIQELCLQIVPMIGMLVDRDAMKTQLLPRLLKLAIDGSVLSIRVMTLLCLGKLLPTLEPWMVSDQVLPAMPKINSREPSILMAILGIYKLAHENEKFGISREQCAKSILPFLISTCVENTLNVNQFEQYMAMIRALMHKVETEQRSRLSQLSAGQETERNTHDFTEIFNQPSTSSNNGELNNLTNMFGNLDSGQSSTTQNTLPSRNQPAKPMAAANPWSPTTQPPSSSFATSAFQPSNPSNETLDISQFFDSPTSKPQSMNQNLFQSTALPKPPTALNPVNRLMGSGQIRNDPFADLLSFNGPSKPPAKTNFANFPQAPVQQKKLENPLDFLQ